MIRIAIVGDIGSGKSYVAKQFGYQVFNADNEVKKIYKNNRKCFRKLKKILPDYIKNFPVQKTEVTNAILSRNNNLKKIIKIIHPEVRKKMNSFIKRNKNSKFVVLDIPLLLENKINKKKDIIVFIDAKKKEINKRLKKRGNINLQLIKKFKKVQLSLEFKKKKSSFIIKNNFKNYSVKKSVRYILKSI